MLFIYRRDLEDSYIISNQFSAALKSDKFLINLQLELKGMIPMHFYLVYQLTKQWEWKLG